MDIKPHFFIHKKTGCQENPGAHFRRRKQQPFRKYSIARFVRDVAPAYIPMMNPGRSIPKDCKPRFQPGLLATPTRLPYKKNMRSRPGEALFRTGTLLHITGRFRRVYGAIPESPAYGPDGEKRPDGYDPPGSRHPGLSPVTSSTNPMRASFAVLLFHEGSGPGTRAGCVTGIIFHKGPCSNEIADYPFARRTSCSQPGRVTAAGTNGPRFSCRYHRLTGFTTGERDMPSKSLYVAITSFLHG